MDALLAKVRELLDDRIKLGLSFSAPSTPDSPTLPLLPGFPPSGALEYLDHLTDPDQVADLVSGAILASPAERQTILETAHLESRLKHLIHFLMAEIRRKRKDTSR